MAVRSAKVKSMEDTKELISGGTKQVAISHWCEGLPDLSPLLLLCTKVLRRELPGRVVTGNHPVIPAHCPLSVSVALGGTRAGESCQDSGLSIPVNFTFCAL